MSNTSRIEHFPISFFAMVMGLAGLTLAWEKANHVLGLGVSVLPVLLAFFALMVFLALAVIYTVKIIRYPAAVKKELNHPVKINFFPAISISLILLGTAMLNISPWLAKPLWMLGAALNLGFTLYIMGVWIHHEHFEVHHFTPAWFIPVVGNVIVPIVGTSYGYTELSWFYFSIGMMFWVVLMTIFFNRVFFHNPMPAKLMPTFFILIAPPAVGVISYVKLVGEVDGFARILFYVGLYLTLLLATQFSRFVKLQFFLSWWAYSFPLAAITVATFMMSEQTGSGALRGMGVVLLTAITFIVALLLFKTFKAALAGKICQPEE